MIAVFFASTVWMLTGRRSIVSSVVFAVANSTMFVSSLPGSTMMRSASGMSWKPALLAHQSLRRSKMRWVGVESTSCQGLVVIGCPFARSRNVNVVGSCPCQTCWGMMWIPMSWWNWK